MLFLYSCSFFSPWQRVVLAVSRRSAVGMSFLGMCYWKAFPQLASCCLHYQQSPPASRLGHTACLRMIAASLNCCSLTLLLHHCCGRPYLSALSLPLIIFFCIFFCDIFYRYRHNSVVKGVMLLLWCQYNYQQIIFSVYFCLKQCVLQKK